jgi:hypothetical protein
MENALSWLHGKGFDLDDDDVAIESFEKIEVSPTNFRSAEERERDRANALDWLRSEGIDTDENSAFT